MWNTDVDHGREAMGRRIAYLLRRGGTFYFRCRVPADLHDRVGRSEIRISLRTSAYDEACRRVATAQFMLSHHFQVLRMPEEQKRPRYEPLFTVDDVARLCQDGKGVIFTGSADQMLDMLKNRLSDTYGALVDAAGQRDAATDAAKAAQDEAADAHRALVKVVNGGAQQPSPVPKGSGLHRDSRKPFVDFIEAYFAMERIEGKQRTNKVTTFKEFASVVGDKPIAEIDRNDIVEFHDRIRCGGGKHGRTASYKTVNKKLCDIRTFLRWCKEQRNLISSNPAESYTADVSQEEREEAEERRRSFAADELQAIFDSPVFKGCKSLDRVLEPGTVLCRDHRFWVPLVGLFSGLRLGEIEHLEFEDIVELHGRQAFWVRKASSHGHKKPVKNRASNRKVPIHPFLVDVGFPSYVANRRAVATDGRVFPAFRYSRFFNETLLHRTLRIKQPDMCFHSFRHCFKDALRNATTDLEARDRLCGHTVDGMSGVYGERFVSREQANAVDEVRFPVDWSHLLP